MIVVGLDLEATGLDKVKDRPIEVGVTLWTTNFNRGLESRSYLVQSDGVSVTNEITGITGITQSMVDKFGILPDDAYDIVVEEFVSRAEAIVAFNGRRFDVPMFHQWAKRLGKQFPDKMIIDPFDGDLPGVRPQELITMCAKLGIYYDPHEAGADVNAMLRLLSKFPFDQVLIRAQSPSVVVKSLQHRSENHLVKKHKFRWQPQEKIWWKAVKQMDLDVLAKEVNNAFGLEVLQGVKPEDLDNE